MFGTTAASRTGHKLPNLDCHGPCCSMKSMVVFLTRFHSTWAPSPPLLPIWNAPGLNTYGFYTHPHTGAPFQTCSAISCSLSCSSGSLSCRCAMSDFHMTLENHGRYLSLETTQLLESQVETCHVLVIFWVTSTNMIYWCILKESSSTIFPTGTPQETCMRAYIKLAVAALQAGELLWPSRPKWHATWYFFDW